MNGLISPLNQTLTKPMLLQGICFALCFFIFQLTEFTVNDRAEVLLCTDKVIIVYSAGILCTALGFLSFSLLRQIFHHEGARKAVLCVIGVIAVISAVLVLITEQPALFIMSALLALFSFGNIGGCVYYNCAMTFQNKGHTGQIIGIGMPFAVLLQFVIQNILFEKTVLIISIAASVLVLIYFVVYPPHDWMLENPLSYSFEKKSEGRTVWILVTAVALMSVICALLDGIVVPAHASGQTSVSDYSRLFYAASLVVAGFVAEMNNGRYLSLVTVCLMFLSTVSGAFFASDASLWIGTVFIYIYSGFYVILLTVRFLKLAPESKNPALLASMGRIVRSLTVAISTIPTALLCKTFGNISLVLGSCVLSIILMLILLRDISLVFTSNKEKTGLVETKEKAQKETVAREKVISSYSRYYDLTPRETEVFEKLITSDDGTQTIADSLYISRRVLQRFIASIHEKTATKNRIGLYQSFHEFSSR